MEMLSTEERNELEQRCGFFDAPAFDLIDVCDDHLKLMTTKFIETTVSKNTCCLWPTHGSTLKLSRLSKNVKTVVGCGGVRCLGRQRGQPQHVVLPDETRAQL